MNAPDPTRALTIDADAAWTCFELLQMTLAGVGHRDETARPWHLESVFRKLVYAIPRLEPPHAAATVDLDLTVGEVEGLLTNIPRTAWQHARAVLLDLMRLHAAFAFDLPILPTDPADPPGTAERLALVRAWGIETARGEEVIE